MHRNRWWSHQGTSRAYAFAGCGPGWHRTDAPGVDDWIAAFASRMESGDFGSGAFGVRRPLRYLAYKLELDDAQTAELATILDDLKTERAQAEVDARRSMAAFADAVAGDTFDGERAGEGGTTRVRSAERLRDAVDRALRRIHGVLRPDQRRRLAYLIRSGTLRI